MLQPVFDAIARRDAAAALPLALAAAAAEPESAAAQHALAAAQQLAGDLEAAEATLEAALERHPEHAGLHVARAHLAWARRQPEQVRGALQQALEQNPNQLQAYLVGVHLALAEGRPEAAAAQLKLAQRIDPEHPTVLLAEGHLALLGGQHDRAIACLTRGLQNDPEDALTLASLGLAFLLSGRWAFAEQTLRRALERQPERLPLRWALFEALRQQGQLDAVVEQLEAILQRQPEQRRALALRVDAELRSGRPQPALAAFARLLSLRPARQAELEPAFELLLAAGLGGELRQAYEHELAARSDADPLWAGRLRLASDSHDHERLVQAWLQALPGSAAAWAEQARLREQAQQLEAAEQAADAALERQPGLWSALQIKLRALLRRDPAALLSLTDALLARSHDRLGRRLALNFRGLALDRLQRYPEAAQAYRDAGQIVLEGAILPPMVARPPVTSDAALDAAAPRLLWGPPGSRVAEVAVMLRIDPQLAVLDDRFGAAPRPDGLWPPRSDGQCVDAASWAATLSGAGIDPGQAIDWLPHWDGRIDAALPAARLLAVIADPRDLWLNFVAFGGPQAWQVPAAEVVARWLAAQLEMLIERQQQWPQQTLLLGADALQRAPGECAGRIADFYALPQALPEIDPAPVRIGLGALPRCFPAGHWRHYQQACENEFALLAPLAARLGFAD